jgi:hypothetical protein
LLSNLSDGAQEFTHGGAGERASDADSPGAQSCQDLNRKAERKHVDRLWSHGLDHLGDLRLFAQARSVKAIRSRLGISPQPPYRLAKIRPAGNETFGSAGQQHAAPRLVDRRTRRRDALDGQSEFVERRLGIARRVLDRKAGDAGVDRQRNIGLDTLWIVGEGILEIGIERESVLLASSERCLSAWSRSTP